ncbi:hypothetical protein EK904_001232 [Melospiza melodia maxima]|nr:hypothetical protein EK904_001232 [Melospiza melodia maxima]
MKLQRIKLIIVGNLDSGNNQVILFIRRTQHTRLTGKEPSASPAPCLPHLLTSGSHCTVRLGHSRACVSSRSYKKGLFFFQILYSPLMTRSSSAAGREGMNPGWRG